MDESPVSIPSSVLSFRTTLFGAVTRQLFWITPPLSVIRVRNNHGEHVKVCWWRFGSHYIPPPYRWVLLWHSNLTSCVSRVMLRQAQRKVRGTMWPGNPCVEKAWCDDDNSVNLWGMCPFYMLFGDIKLHFIAVIVARLICWQNGKSGNQHLSYCFGGNWRCW